MSKSLKPDWYQIIGLALAVFAVVVLFYKAMFGSETAVLGVTMLVCTILTILFLYDINKNLEKVLLK